MGIPKYKREPFPLCWSAMIFLTALAIVLLSSARILSASLHDACMTGNLELAKLALEDPKLDVNLPDPDGYTPLGRLIQDPDAPQSNMLSEIATLLLKHRRINPNLGNIVTGEGALHLAIKHRNVVIVNRLLKMENLRLNLKIPNNHQYCTPLLLAIKSLDTNDAQAKSRSLGILKKLLKKTQVDLNIDCGDKIPIVEIAKYADEEVFGIIVDRRPENINAQDKEGNGVLHAALQSENVLEAFQNLGRIYKLNYNLTDRNGNTALHLACMNLDNPKIQKLLTPDITSKFSWNVHNFNGETPFHLLLKAVLESGAATAKESAALEIFESNSYSFKLHNVDDQNGDTVLHLFVKYLIKRLHDEVDQQEMEKLSTCVSTFKSREFDVNNQNKEGQSIFHLLARVPIKFSIILEMVEWLFKNPNFEPNLPDIKGQVALDIATENGNYQLFDKIWQINAWKEDIILRLLEVPPKVDPQESMETKSSEIGFLNMALSNRWPSVANVLLTEPVFGYTEEFFKSSKNFLTTALEFKNDELTNNMWNLYKNHIKISQEERLFDRLLEIGSEEIYDHLVVNNYNVSEIYISSKNFGYYQLTKFHFAAQHGWMDFLRANADKLEYINLESKEGNTLLDMAFMQHDYQKRSRVLDFLVEEPKKVDLCKVVSDRKLSLQTLFEGSSEKFAEEIFQCFIQIYPQMDSQTKESMASEIEELLLLAYKDSQYQTFLKFLKVYESFPRTDEQKAIFAKKRMDSFRSAVLDNVDSYNTTIFTVDRKHLVESCKTQLKILEEEGAEMAKAKLYIKFLEEAGGDGGALSREFFALLGLEIFHQDHLFQLIGEKTKYVTVKIPDANIAADMPEERLNEETLNEYRFAGKIIGLAIINQHPLAELLASSLLRLIMGLPEHWRDLEEIDLGKCETLKQLYM